MKKEGKSHDGKECEWYHWVRESGGFLAVNISCIITYADVSIRHFVPVHAQAVAINLLSSGKPTLLFFLNRHEQT